IPVRTRGNRRRIAAGREDGELGNDPGGADAADLVGSVFRKPEVAVGTGDDAQRAAARRGNGECGKADGQQTALFQSFEDGSVKLAVRSWHGAISGATAK